VRASSERTLTRLLNEHRAGTFLGDVVAVSGIQSGILKAKGALDRYQSLEAVNFPAEWRDPDGYGTGLHQTIYVIGYNSSLVSADAAPKSYEDLLQPRWNGQLGWDTEEYYLFGALLKARGKEKGLEYWRRLAAQQINFRKGYTLISELVAAGEFPVAVSLYQHRVDEYAEKGAPLPVDRAEPARRRRPEYNFPVKKCAAAQRSQIIHRLYAIGRRSEIAPGQRPESGQTRHGTAKPSPERSQDFYVARKC
jgi:ABC-type Fe3+ transport system substrate-binding protein